MPLSTCSSTSATRMHVPRNIGSQWQMAGSATMYWTEVFVSIVTVSIVFHLIYPVRFCDCRGGAEVGCGCDRFRGRGLWHVRRRGGVFRVWGGLWSCYRLCLLFCRVAWVVNWSVDLCINNHVEKVFIGLENVSTAGYSSFSHILSCITSS